MDFRTATTAERAADFIATATKLHAGRYDYLHVTDQYKNGTTAVSIICALHGVFSQKPQDHRRGQGCGKCSLRDGANRELRKQSFLAKARAQHGNRYDYSRVKFVGMKTTVTIGCKTHGWITTRPDNHIAKDALGCKLCGASRGRKAVKRDEEGKWAARRRPSA
jgi:hypothetical protein